MRYRNLRREWSVRHLRATAAALVFLLPAAAASAQDAAPAADQAATQQDAAKPIAPDHLAAARKAIAAIGATDQFDNILPNAATQLKSELIVNNPDLEDQISDMVDQKALDLASRRGALENEVARIYATIFSKQELQSITDFYTSDAGKKLLSEGPNATREMMSSAEVWGNGIMRDLRQASLEGMNELYQKSEKASGNGNGNAATSGGTGTAPQK